MRPLPVALLALLVAGCAGDQNEPDASLDAGLDARDANGGDAGADAGDGVDGGSDAGADLDPGSFLAVEVPAGAQLCTLGGWGDVLEDIRHKVRITFKEGQLLLPRDQDRFEADWIERVEVSPAAAVLIPAGAGEFTWAERSFPGEEGNITYEFHQSFEHDAQGYELTVWVAFLIEGGEPAEPVLLLDEAALTAGWLIGAGVTFPDHETGTASCSCAFGLLDRWRVDLTFFNGDRMQLNLHTVMERCPPGMGCAGGSGEGHIQRASLERGQDRREVTDFFQTAFTAVHHLGGQSYLVVLDSPIGNLHAIHVTNADVVEGTVDYLDDRWNVVESGAVTDRRYTPEP